MKEPIRIFIGTEPKTEIARKVLECSIRRRTDPAVKIEFTPMLDDPFWEYDAKDLRQGTGFSLRRWLIPEHCKWQGRAIYLDADQLVLGDIRELWNKPKQQPAVGASAWLSYQADKFSKTPWPQSAVMVIDCEAAKTGGFGWQRAAMLGHLRRHAERYPDFMHAIWMTVPPSAIGNEWNHLNVYKPEKTRLLHFTKEPEQPWYKPDHPLAHLWQTELQVAIKLGYLDKEEYEGALDRWKKFEDWRPQNGLHPHYRRYLKLFPS